MLLFAMRNGVTGSTEGRIIGTLPADLIPAMNVYFVFSGPTSTGDLEHGRAQINEEGILSYYTTKRLNNAYGSVVYLAKE